MQWRSARILVLVLGLAVLILSCAGNDEPVTSGAAGSGSPADDLRMVRTGGMGTAFDESERAFSLTARNINHAERQVFADGKAVFEIEWTAPPADDFGGLGPNFDAASCATCHTEDGRSGGPAGDGPLPVGLTARVVTDDPATIDHHGAVLSADAVVGTAEAVVSVRYEEIEGRFDDGEPYSLRRPRYLVEIIDGPALPPDAVIGVRVAPQLPGLGLLELVPDADLVARADPGDVDDDGISGRPGVATELLGDTPAIGRFGWNATQPTVEQQTATALFNDMGITSRYFPTADCDRWAPCVREGIPLSTEYSVEEYGDPDLGLVIPEGGGEISDRRLLDLVVYTQTLAVPAPRDVGDPQVEAGWEIFQEVGCSSCHGGSYTTDDGPIEGLSRQVIEPYTDLLVHDLGAGLADRTLDGEPVVTEWRTPPLWGIGLLDTVSGHTDLLHDGRARGYEEAILWHDGEATASAAAYRALPATDRAAVIRFLESL